MYLLGILIWIAVVVLLARLATSRVKNAVVRAVLVTLAVPLSFVLALADEIVGKFQFDRLCAEAKEVKIHATHPVGEELYTPEGKWRVGDTLEERNRISTIHESLLRWDSGTPTPEVVPGTIPIRRYHTKIYDRNDGRLLTEWYRYGTPGGWLGRWIGGPILVEKLCIPPDVKQGSIDQLLLPYTKKSGEKK